jgi:putative sugar O-methyltransferase
MSRLFKAFFPVMDFALSRLPFRVRRRLIHGLSIYRWGEALEHARAVGIRGKWTREEPDLGGDGAELARILGGIWLAMKDRQNTVPADYLAAPTWASLLETEWSGPRKWLEADDFAAFEAFLRNFFRNGVISGFWDDRHMFDQFVAAPQSSDLKRLVMFLRQFETWRCEIPGGNLDDLDEARVGNPWGYDVDGRLVVEPAFEYHTLALRIRDLVADVTHPVILEIGGGFGGLARQILRLIPGVRYIGLDLPENVIIQSWYLTRSLPDRRIRVNEIDKANQALTEADALLLPNWAIADLDVSRLDVIVNAHSFGEMDPGTLDTYFAEFMRLRPEWIFHDNLGSPRGDGLYGISSTEYPSLHGYQMVASCESRWPRYDRHSAYPCRENLFRLLRSPPRADVVR